MEEKWRIMNMINNNTPVNKHNVISDNERTKVAQDILNVLSQSTTPNSEGWYDLVKLAPELITHGINYKNYGFSKLTIFLETVFGDSIQRHNQGTMVYLKFSSLKITTDELSTNKPNIPSINSTNSDKALLQGFKIGEVVEINTYGVIKCGKISNFDDYFVELSIENNRCVRIRYEAISSIEPLAKNYSSTNSSAKSILAHNHDDIAEQKAIKQQILLPINTKKVNAELNDNNTDSQTSVTVGTQKNLDAVTMEENSTDKQSPGTNNNKHPIYTPETETLPGVKIVGKIDLGETVSKNFQGSNVGSHLSQPKANSLISISDSDCLLPSMGRLKQIGNKFGFIKPSGQESDLYFPISEIVSYYGIIDKPSEGDEVIFTLGKNAKGPIAVCVHKQCSRSTLEDLMEKMRNFSSKTYFQLKKQLEDLERPASNDEEEDVRLSYYLNKMGINSNESFDPNEVEKLLSNREQFTPEEYIKAINLLINEVIKIDYSKSYNLFLRSISYARLHTMYDCAEQLIRKALNVFSKESAKTGYFNSLLKKIANLSERIVITDATIEKNLDISNHNFPSMSDYVKDAILDYKDFNGIVRDKDTIRTGLYKKEYIEELKETIKKNDADDTLYLTLMKLELAFNPKNYDPTSDMSKFLSNRAKKLLASGNRQKFDEVRYLLRLSYRIKSLEKGFDDTVGLYLMTLGDYGLSDIATYMGGGQTNYDELLKNIHLGIDNITLELALLSASNKTIENLIKKRYKEMGKKTDDLDYIIGHVNKLKSNYNQYAANPLTGFQDFISSLEEEPILLCVEKDFINNDAVKILSRITDFNNADNYADLLMAYKNIKEMLDKAKKQLISQPTEIGYEIILPVFRLLDKKILEKFAELEERSIPDISVTIISAIELIDNKNTINLDIEIRNSKRSARNIYLKTLKIMGDDLYESNSNSIDLTLKAGEEKLLHLELSLIEHVVEEKVAELEFNLEYDDMFVATDKHIPGHYSVTKTINFENKAFTEIENKFIQSSGGQELDEFDPMFYGRKNIVERICSQIMSGRNNQIAIYGQKRSGKSSLLNQIKGKLKSESSHFVICEKFSLQNLPNDENNPVRWILSEIADTVIRGIPERGRSIIDRSIINREMIKKYFNKEENPFKALKNFIEDINSYISNYFQNPHIVVLIDEFTFLYQKIKEGQVGQDFMRRWKAMIESPNINLQTVVAAQDTLPHFMNESYAANSFNIFSKEPLSYLSKEETLQLIKEPVKDSVQYHNHSDELIYEYTAGSPYFTQIFCRSLIDYLNQQKTHTVGKDEITTVAEQLCRGTGRLDSYIFECLIIEADGSAYDQKENGVVLKEIALQTRAGGYVNVEDIKVNLSPQRLEEVLENLLTRNVIAKKDKGYSINVQLFRQWIQNN